MLGDANHRTRVDSNDLMGIVQDGANRANQAPHPAPEREAVALWLAESFLTRKWRICRPVDLRINERLAFDDAWTMFVGVECQARLSDVQDELEAAFQDIRSVILAALRLRAQGLLAPSLDGVSDIDAGTYVCQSDGRRFAGLAVTVFSEPLRNVKPRLVRPAQPAAFTAFERAQGARPDCNWELVSGFDAMEFP